MKRIGVRMARAEIMLVLVVGLVAFRGHALPPAPRAGTDAAQQISMAASAAGSQRLRDEIKKLEEMLPRLVDRGAALFLLAHDYARLGEEAKALELLKQCVALDEGFDPGGD